jgi:hypothetical protein
VNTASASSLSCIALKALGSLTRASVQCNDPGNQLLSAAKRITYLPGVQSVYENNPQFAKQKMAALRSSTLWPMGMISTTHAV